MHHSSTHTCGLGPIGDVHYAGLFSMMLFDVYLDSPCVRRWIERLDYLVEGRHGGVIKGSWDFPSEYIGAGERPRAKLVMRIAS